MQPNHEAITKACAEATAFLRGTLMEVASAGATPHMLYSVVEAMRALQNGNMEECHGGMMMNAAPLRSLSVQPIMPEEAAHVFKEMEGMLQLLQSHYPLPRTEDDSEPKA